MAGERKRVMGEIFAWHLAGVVGHMPFTARALNPADINPYKGVRRDSPQLARIKAVIASMTLRAIARGGSLDDED